MKTVKFIATGAAIFGASILTASAADARSYSGGTFALELDGSSGLIQSVEGGDAVAEVTTVTEGAGFIAKKHIGNVKYEEVSLQCGFTLPKPIYDWISGTFDGKKPRKDGAIVSADFNYVARDRGSFRNALITEVSIPACDASSRNPGYLNVKFAPELLEWTAPTGVKTGVIARKQKTWTSANFRLDVPGLDCSRVTKIDGFTVKQEVLDYSSGLVRDPIRIPGRIEFPNLRITLPSAFAGSWLAWADKFLVKGNNGDDQEKDGTLTFLSPDLKEELVRVSFSHMGVARVHRSLSSPGETTSTVTVELYVEAMQIDFMAQFE